MRRRRGSIRAARPLLAELILQRAGRPPGCCRNAAPARGRGRADPARRLALRPQGNADRRRAACVRPLARRRAARGDRCPAIDDERSRGKARRLRRGGNGRAWSMRWTAASSRRARPARRRAGARTCCRPGAICFRSIRAPIPTRTAWEIGQRARRATCIDALSAGPWRLAAPHRARPVGQRHDAHRRRRSRAGLRPARRAAALGRRLDARERL